MCNFSIILNICDTIFFVYRGLLAVRSQYGMQDDGARFHVISHMIRETVNCGKSILVTSIIGRDESADSGSNAKETGTLHNLIQKDRVCAAVGTEFYFSAFPLLLIQFTLYCYWCTSSYIFQILLNNNTITPVSYVFLQNWLQKTCCLAGLCYSVTYIKIGV